MRIASLSPAATEILYSLGLEDQIVCTDQFSNFPDEARELPKVRGHQEIEIAALEEFQPEIIFTGTVIQQRLSEELSRRGLSVVHQDPRTINGVYESIKELGMLFRLEKEAGELVLSMQQGFNDVKRKAGLLPKRLRLYIEEWHDPPFASGNWVPELARIAGGEQYPVQPGELSTEVTLEQVLEHDPDLIILSLCGARDSTDPALLTEREGWDALRAVQEGNMRVIDDSLLNRPGPRLVEGAQRLYGWIFEQLH